MSEAQHEKAEWLSVGRAAIRLGTTVPALRKEIKAGE
jgi:DNA-binding transcriptional LysR family regulator